MMSDLRLKSPASDCSATFYDTSSVVDNTDLNDNTEKRTRFPAFVRLVSDDVQSTDRKSDNATISTLSPYVSSTIVNNSTGLNLTISNGKINLKNSIGGKLPVNASSCSAMFPVSCPASSSIPVTFVKGLVPLMPTPLASIATTFHTQLFGNVHVNQAHTQLKVPNPSTLQLLHPQQAPQIFSALQSPGMVAMQNHFPAAGSHVIQGVIPSTVNALCSVEQGTVNSSLLQIHAMATNSLCGSMVSFGTGLRQHVQAQPLPLRSATAFPVLLSRSLTLTGARPRLFSAQPIRLAARQSGAPLALQVGGQQLGTATVTAVVPAISACGFSAIPGDSKPVSHGLSIMESASMLTYQAESVQTTLASQVNFRPSFSQLNHAARAQDGQSVHNIPISNLPCPPKNSAPLLNADTCSVSQSASSILSKTDSIVPSSIIEMGRSQNVLFSDDSASRTAITTPVKPERESTVTVAPSKTLRGVSVNKVDAAMCTSSAYATTAGGLCSPTVSPSKFNAATDMNWTDGIASLPGSSLKFKLNDLGMMEVVSDESSAALLRQQEAMTIDSNVGVNIGLPPTPSKMLPSSVMRRCEHCGKCGEASQFCKTGRFCSQSCVGAHAGSKNKQSYQPLSKDSVVSMKKRKLKLLKRKLNIDFCTVEGDNCGRNKDNPMQGRKGRAFDWQVYLEEQTAVAAPVRLFRNTLPIQKNGFKVGMRLEGVDPKHQMLFCVLSVAEIQGHRVRLHFDGYSECYDFWRFIDSPFMFPVGWCEKNAKLLQPPKHIPFHKFNWMAYLRSTKSIAAPKTLFPNPPSAAVTPSAFRVGMKLEAVDAKNMELVCVATVADLLADKVLVHFDGWEDTYDYWCDVTSPCIHPVGWCRDNSGSLMPPSSWGDDGVSFSWDDYLSQTKAQAVPSRAFKTRPVAGFGVGMKLEAVDCRNPIIIRTATVLDVKEHRLQIHFDGWPSVYDYWVDDETSDIRPVGWCRRTGVMIEPPYVKESHTQGTCPTPGCNGVGHIKGAKYTGHHSTFGCPYSVTNLDKGCTLQDRLGSTRSEENSLLPTPLLKEDLVELKKCPTPGCDSSGHVTGKFTSHHRRSGCPLLEKNFVSGKDELPTPFVNRPVRNRKRRLINLDELDDIYQQDDRSVRAGSQEHDGSPTTFTESVHESVFKSAVPSSPSQEGPVFWDHHIRLMPVAFRAKGEAVRAWSVEEVASFVGSLPGCEHLNRVFREQEIDGDSFLMLTQADIVKIMGVKLGPALKIYNSVLHCQRTLDW